MTITYSTIRDRCDSEKSYLADDRLTKLARVLTAVALVGSAFHFWPFEDNHLWQLLCPSNLAVLVWVVIYITYSVISRKGQQFKAHLPHISVIAFVVVNNLSLAFSPDPVRTVIFVSKLSLMFLGTYNLLIYAVGDWGQLKRIYQLAVIAVLISVSYSLITRFGLGWDVFGFHRNPFKYGTYLGMLVPMVSVFIFFSKNSANKIWAVVLVIASTITAGTVGTILAIFTGIAAAVITMGKGFVRLIMITSLVMALILLALLWESPALAALRNDCRLREQKSADIRQRYIEWQAELNLLEDRPITGTGAGCINEYRSEYYYRLPKLNTLKPFDQNGYLAIAAESGILGLVCFSWVILYYFNCAWQQIVQIKKTGNQDKLMYPIANMAGMVGACTAHLFSSVQYNGILLGFIVILVLIDKTGENLSEEHP